MPYLLLTPLKLELATELRLDRPLSLAELVSNGKVCVGESGPGSSLTAESGLSASELFILTLALFLAALFRNERSEFSIWERNLDYSAGLRFLKRKRSRSNNKKKKNCDRYIV